MPEFTSHDVATALDVQAVANHYGVSSSTIARWQLHRMFPSPLRLGGVRRWLLSDLDKHAAWLVARAAAEVHGLDPDDVQQPEYAIPIGRPLRRLPATAPAKDA